MISLRPARPSDPAAVAACVCEAYVHYIERIGKQPGPMLEDYADGLIPREHSICASAPGSPTLITAILGGCANRSSRRIRSCRQ